MTDNTGLSKAMRTELEAQIRTEMDDLSALSEMSADGRAPVTLDQQSVGRLSRMDAMQQQHMNIAREDRRQLRLKMLASALDRLAGDEFGTCLVCGEQIPYKRLKADPVVTRCIDCIHQET